MNILDDIYGESPLCHASVFKAGNVFPGIIYLSKPNVILISNDYCKDPNFGLMMNIFVQILSHYLTLIYAIIDV
jgi:hypothetical protein